MRVKRIVLFLIKGLVVLSFLPIMAFRADDASVLNSADQKKLEKASKIEQQAIDKGKEADAFYAKSASASSSADPSEVEKLNNNRV